MSTPLVAAALAMARLRAWRVSLLALHKRLIDAERIRYERVRGPIGGPHQALHLLMHDEWFAWLRPVGALIVRIDERLADDTPIAPEELQGWAADIRALVRSDALEPFGVRYRQVLQDVPDVVVAHGQLVALLKEGAGPRGEVRPTSSARRPADGPP
jgi:hypothetical protein